MQFLRLLYFYKTDPYKVFDDFFESWHTQDQYKRKQCCKSSSWWNIWNLLHKQKYCVQLIYHTDKYKST